MPSAAAAIAWLRFDRQHAATDDLGAEPRLVQRKPDDRGREGVELDATAGSAS
jgi:hypothetical protein